MLLLCYSAKADDNATNLLATANGSGYQNLTPAQQVSVQALLWDRLALMCGTANDPAPSLLTSATSLKYLSLTPPQLQTVGLLLLDRFSKFSGGGGSATNAQPPSANLTNWSNVGTNQVLYTNALPGLTNGFVTASITNGLATTNYVIDATNNLGNSVAVTMTNAANQFVGMLNWGYGNGNFFVGGAGNTNMSGTQNIGIGDFALYFNSSGIENVAFGYAALVYNTIGQNNLAVGRYALFANTNGNNNTAIGAAALENNTCGSDNLAVGQASLGLNTSGSNNVAIGVLAGYFNNPTASSNVDIASDGNPSDVNIIRIGDAQTDAYIAGIIHCNGGGLTNHTILTNNTLV